MERRPSADFALARRLERTEASANAAFVEARAALDPSVGATWIDVAGTYAMFDGAGSPLTQTFGFGLFHPFLAPEFLAVEAFFAERGTSTFHEVSSFAPEASQRLLAERGYLPIEHSTVLIRDTTPGEATSPAISVRQIAVAECEQWARTSALGWASESADLASFVEQLGLVISRARGAHCFLAEIDGEPVAAGALYLLDGVALLAGASTIPSFRQRGAQRALFDARLEFAATRGADLAMVVTQPASGSERNARRRGFHPAYSRTKWERRA